MKKMVLSAAILSALSTTAFQASASLSGSSVLNIDQGVRTCVYGPSPTSGKSYNENGCAWGVQAVSGSYFAMDTNGDGFTVSENTYIEGKNGIVLGMIQNASGSHAGAIDGSESPDIDQPWFFFSNTGMHQTTSAISILSDNGDGNVDLDFSGWSVTWNGIPDINMGGGIHNCGTSSDGICVNDDGIDIAGVFNNGSSVASITCGIDCSAGDSYTLEYLATVWQSDPANSGVNYKLRLEGTVAIVPVPAAVWLFSSGILCLLGMAHRRKSI